ncbi:LysR family transcriptional regulator [Pseudoalteromonas ruthenica]|uniref:LysR family transcriptional regulator n=1 Tax=Pseudoalteromonas ruthenica TaxID=151081 RepID=UPI00110AE264|nr:LysR family transcriptional regulator [Pseudoalteromonas ruthenica]TMO48943.1 LysR family transcriptional regulator [Pseudoalteromonas ruthenica]TMO51071.1 LysR family transcriptional regulator [Pseudoalteromonas ruthenica]
MNLRQIDLNLLVYLNVLIEECSVSAAANRLALTQSAMSNALKRLRDLFADPLLVRSGSTMLCTQKALALKPELEQFIALAQGITSQQQPFDAKTSSHTFRVMANEFLVSSMLVPLIKELCCHYADIHIDLVNPSDVTLSELEQGQVDIAIDRFMRLPSSFHQKTLWRDNYCCLSDQSHPIQQDTCLESYLSAPHIWLNRNGFGPEPLVKNREPQKLGWVDQALMQLGERRNIRVYARQHSLIPSLCEHSQLIATLPKRLAEHLVATSSQKLAICPVPFPIVPISVSMLWSPLVHHNNAHIWLRQQLLQFAH